MTSEDKALIEEYNLAKIKKEIARERGEMTWSQAIGLLLLVATVTIGAVTGMHHYNQRRLANGGGIDYARINRQVATYGQRQDLKQQAERIMARQEIKRAIIELEISRLRRRGR